jgi:predicted amidohydrolase YtcJ
VTHCLEAISAARKKVPGARRDRIEHVQLYRDEDLALFRDLGVVASVQPRFVASDWSVAEKRWGHERCRTGYAWKSLMKVGIAMQFGSDAPVEPIAPILGIQASVTRQTPAGDPAGGWFPEERLTLEETLLGFTQVAAFNSGREREHGKVAPGKWADLTVFSQDLFRVDPSEWPGVEVEMTVVGGEVAYRKEA